MFASTTSATTTMFASGGSVSAKFRATAAPARAPTRVVIESATNDARDDGDRERGGGVDGADGDAGGVMRDARREARGDGEWRDYRSGVSSVGDARARMETRRGDDANSMGRDD